MELSTNTVDSVLVVNLAGDLDARTAPAVQEQISALLDGAERMLLDFTGVPYISSAGLRGLLLVYRQARSTGTRVAVVGLSEELRGVLVATGFLDFLLVAETVPAGIAELSGSPS